MIIDINKMFNYQIINNGSVVVGVLHSYSPSMLTNTYLNSNLIFCRKNKMAKSIVKAVLIEE